MEIPKEPKIIMTTYTFPPNFLWGAARQLARARFLHHLVDALCAANIEQFLTLYHWDLPQALQDEGGWANRDTCYALPKTQPGLWIGA